MSACAMLTYNNITDAVWQCALNTVGQYGVVISSDAGTISMQGFTIEWNYDRPSETLSIQCTDSPFWAPCLVINGHIKSTIEACLAQHESDATNTPPG